MSEVLFFPYSILPNQTSFQLTNAEFERIWQLNDKHQLPRLDINGQKSQVVIKKQQQVPTRSWLHPFKGETELAREYRNIRRLKKHHIHTLDILAFGQYKDRSLLILQPTYDFKAMSQLNFRQLSAAEKYTLLTTIAEELACLHLNHFQHGNMAPENILLKQQHNGWQIKLSGLGKLRRVPYVAVASRHDISSFFMQTTSILDDECQSQFLSVYYDCLELA